MIQVEKLMRDKSAIKGYQVMNLRLGSVVLFLIGVSTVFFADFNLFHKVLVIISTLILSICFLIRAQMIAKVENINKFY
jgi:hypothetical protein